MPVGSQAEPKLFVGQIPATCTEEEITTKFKECGEIKSCMILRHLDGRTKGGAMVAFVTFADAEKAIQKFHGNPFNPFYDMLLVEDHGTKKRLTIAGEPFTEGERAMVVNFATPKHQGGGNSASGSAPIAVEEKSVFVGKLPKTVTQEEV